MTPRGGLYTSALNSWCYGTEAGKWNAQPGEKDDQGREERQGCEKSLAKGVFHPELVESSGSWAGSKTLNSSEVSFLAAGIAEFNLAQSGYRLTIPAFFPLIHLSLFLKITILMVDK